MVIAATSQNMKASTSLSASHKKQLRDLAKLDKVWVSPNTKVGRFLEQYLLAEAIARLLIKVKSGKPCPRTLNFTSIRSAVKVLNLYPIIDNNLVEYIFRSDKRYNTGLETPRIYRNKIVHEISKEVILKYEKDASRLSSLLDRWLTPFLTI